MTKTRICHFACRITGKADGVYTHLKMIFNYCDRDKYENYLIFQGDETIVTELTGMGVKVFVMNSLSKKFSLKLFLDLHSFLRSNKIDIIHCHLLKPYIIAGLTNIFLGKKLIFNYNGLFINTIYYTALDKIIYFIAHMIICIFKSVDVAIVPSYNSKKLILKETSLFPRIEVYYNGFYGDFQKSSNYAILNKINEIKKSHYLVGIIARIEIQKRIDLAIEVLKKISGIRNDVFFLFMGDGPLENEMKDIVKNYNLQNNCEILGFVPNASSYIRNFDILLFTSDWEGLPLTLWEAMASGIPVVSTNVGGVKEILDSVSCGITFPKGDVEEGYKQLNLLLNNKEKRKNMGKNAVEAIKNKYNSECFGQFINNLYSNLLMKN